MQDFIQTALTPSTADSRERIASRFGDIEAEAKRFFVEAGFESDAVTTERFGDLRYHGQEHTVRVSFPSGPLDVAAVNDAFHGLHERTYTYRLDSAIELVNYHVVARVETPKPSLAGTVASGTGRPKGRRLVDFDEAGRLEATIYERSDLAPGESIAGPAVIEEPASTTVVYPGQRVTLDAIGNLRIEIGE
jgi:N-methylhydantoinase A